MKIIAEFDECLDCKVDAWLMKPIVRGEQEKGNMGDDVVASTRVAIFSNIDPRKPPIIGGRIPSARVFYDICTKCGEERAIRIEEGHVTMPATPGAIPIFS